jgi:hypothetical protein
MVTKAKHLAAARAKVGKDLSPKWDNTLDLSTDQYARHFRISMEWYRLESSGKELKPKVINWMSAKGYSKTDIANFKKSKDSRCSPTMGAIAACLLKGMPEQRADWNEGRSSAEWLKTSIQKVIDESKYDVDEEAAAEASEANKPSVYIPSIQERLREAAIGMTEEIEDAIELFQEDPEAFDPKAFKLLNLLKAKGAKAAHTRIIRNFYSSNLDELIEAANTKDEQLKEGYAHLSKAQLKKITAFYQEIISACDMLGQEAKVNRKPRAKKVVPADKLVSKLKYMKTNEPLKLVSINPADIVGAKELWIFNIKTRKIGKYVADEYKELGVKGTTVTGFNINLSVQKTLRKPEEQLKEFKAAGKVQLRKFLDDIKAVDIKLNGRINEDTILLKVS